MAFRSYAGIVLGLVVASCGKAEVPAKNEPRVSRDEFRVGNQSLEELMKLRDALPPDRRERFTKLFRSLSERQAGSDAAEDPEMRELVAWLQDSRELEALPAASTASVDPAHTDTNDAYSFGLKTREYELWLHAGSVPPLYTVKSLDGRVLAAALDDAGLERDYPELHHLVHNAVDTAVGDGGYMGLGDSDDR